MEFFEEWVWTPEFGEHAELGPSGAAGWLRCLGKPNAERGIPDSAGYEAAEGTVFHEYAEMALKFGLEPEDFKVGTPMTVEAGGKWYTIAYDQAMVEGMRAGLKFVRDLMDQYPDAILYVEQKVNLVPWCGPAQFGTTDVCIVIPSQRLMVVFDWKYGGIPVYPKENEQASLYALGSWVSYAGKHFGMDPHGVEVHIHIEQPRAPGGGGDWHTTMTDLLEWGKDVKIKADLTRDPNAPRTAGEKQCRYCRAKRTCNTYARHKMDLFSMKFEDIDTGFENGTPPQMPEIPELTPERLAYIWLNKAAFMKFFDDIHDFLLKEHELGRPTPLLKVVDGRAGPRKFKPSEVDVVADVLEGLLGEEAYEPRKLRSPAQAEEKLGKKAFKTLFADMVEQAPPGRSLVPALDAREAKTPLPDKFTDDDII